MDERISDDDDDDDDDDWLLWFKFSHLFRSLLRFSSFFFLKVEGQAAPAKRAEPGSHP